MHQDFLFALLGPASNNFFYIFELYYHTGVGTPKISNLGKAIVIDLERKKERREITVLIVATMFATQPSATPPGQCTHFARTNFLLVITVSSFVIYSEIHSDHICFVK